MAEHPAIPFWTDAYLGDTSHLSTLEHGAYLLLLFTMWRTKNGYIENDDKLLARYSRLTTAQWLKIKPVIMKFLIVSPEGLTQGRLMDEFKAVRQHSKNQSRRANARWLKEKETDNTTASFGYNSGNATPTPTPSPFKKPPTPSNSASKKNGVLKNGFGGSFKIENLLSDEAWQDARSHAPQWDIHHLCKVYDEGINSGRREKPKYPNKAFPIWCKNYTKGKAP